MVRTAVCLTARRGFESLHSRQRKYIMTQNKEKNRDKRLDNLIPFKPGQSGNPAGRPKNEFSMTVALREILNEVDPKTKVERYKNLLNVAIGKAEKGDNDMLKYLINRIEGLPKGEMSGVNISEVDKLVIVVKE